MGDSGSSLGVGVGCTGDQRSELMLQGHNNGSV